MECGGLGLGPETLPAFESLDLVWRAVPVILKRDALDDGQSELFKKICDRNVGLLHKIVRFGSPQVGVFERMNNEYRNID